MSGATIWEQFTLDPRPPENAHLRAGDHDRDVVNDLLGTAYSEGRLTAEELDERTDRVAGSKTLGELPPIIADLVAPVDRRPSVVLPTDLRAEAERKYRQRRHQALLGWLTPTLICWVVWSVTMFGEFPWPVFVTLGTGVRFLQLVGTRHDTINNIEHSLQRRERRRLESRQRRDRRRQLGGPPPPPDAAP